jgi:thymidylate synthase
MNWQTLIYGPLISHGNFVSPRGQLTREQLGWYFRFQQHQRFISHRLMPLNTGYLATELAWYIKGDNKDLSIADHAELWKSMINIDGTLTSNYGYQLWGRDQAPLKPAVTELKRDPNTRRAVVHINRPEHNFGGYKDIPCTMYLQFFIRDETLVTLVSMRSQDAVYGLRNDLPFFWFVADVVAKIMGIKKQELFLTVGSFHVYEKHFDKVKQVVDDAAGWIGMEVSWTKEVDSVCNRIA